MQMNINKIDPSEYFTGYDRKGWLDYPNRFLCPKCDYGVYFSRQSLEKGSVNHQDKPLKLNSEDAVFFMDQIRQFLAGVTERRKRFVLDFYCPKCKVPYVIGFEEADLHKDDYHYRPIVILGGS